ncbi:MAG: 2-C-methyl-D-erythritol 4-phosphate cytidylyltransferase [Paludibacter sp.]|jgi:2-C-methyl-D-erythritol 4-phosphate cytidylyltransferase|nr:2-C-methyl-D-erythritol 4-phosphate cytidylyltransferase [Paludibacter sp.]
MNKTKFAIIVAGGKGERMQTDIPKQFIEIQGKPILMYSIENFIRYDISIQIILVLPTGQIEFWHTLCKKHAFEIPHKIVTGGQSRFDSVKKGLDAINIPALIAVHDGVRPLVSVKTITRCFKGAEKYGTAIPVIELVDSIRQITETGNQSVDRNTYKLVQTPQIFDGELLKKAYKQEFSTLFTDDASVVEAMGTKIHLVEGNRENIKITTEFDLRIAEIMM